MDIPSRIKAGYESIRLSFSKKSIFEKCVFLISIPLTIYAVYLLAGILFHTVMDSGIPNEYREAANVFLTMELMKGNNPYALSALKGSLPPMIYLYGPLYSLITAAAGGFLNLFGFVPDIVSLHYAITFICILVSGCLAFKMVYEKTGKLPFALAAFIFLINCSWRYNYVNAVPDSLGLMIMMLILFLLLREGFRLQEILMAILTVAIFFTKQYYLLIAGTATAFLFLYKGIRSVCRYLISFVAAALITAGILLAKCPLFATYMLYLAKGPGKGVASNVTRGSVKMSGMAYNLSQVMSLGGIFFFFFLTETICCIILLVRLCKNFKADGNAKENLKVRLLKSGEGAGIDKFGILMIIHLIVSGICLTYLGRNDGAWLSYYLELFMPALIMGALALFDKELEVILKGSRDIIKCLMILYFVLLLIFPIFTSANRLPASPVSESDRAEWKKAVEALDANPGDMYLYPHLAYYGIENGIYVYNTGQPFVVSEKFYKSYHKHPEKMKRYPYAEDVFTEHFAYREKIRERIQAGEYSVVSYIEGQDEIVSREELSINYRLQGVYPLRTGRQIWDTEIWIKK